jgi:hypothetical protein
MKTAEIMANGMAQYHGNSYQSVIINSNSEMWHQ